MLIPNRLAAVLAGRSYKVFGRDLAPHCRSGRGVSLAALESLLGVEFEPATLWHANQRLNGLRSRERAYKQRTA